MYFAADFGSAGAKSGTGTSITQIESGGEIWRRKDWAWARNRAVDGACRRLRQTPGFNTDSVDREKKTFSGFHTKKRPPRPEDPADKGLLSGTEVG